LTPVELPARDSPGVSAAKGPPSCSNERMEASGDHDDGRANREMSTDRANAESLVRAARAQGVTDPRVLEALRAVRRASFVPRELRNEVGYDCAIPIGRAQTTSQPSLIGLMIEALELGPEDTVLEVGTGHGYQAALLAKLARRVFSVERISELAQVARLNLSAQGVSNVEVVTGDGHARPSRLCSLRRHRGSRLLSFASRPRSRAQAHPRRQARHARRERGRRSREGFSRSTTASWWNCGCCVELVSCPCSGERIRGRLELSPVREQGHRCVQSGPGPRRPDRPSGTFLAIHDRPVLPQLRGHVFASRRVVPNSPLRGIGIE